MLKKIAVILGALTALSGLSYAADSTPVLLDSMTSSINFKTSINVKVAYRNEGGTVPQKYAIVSKHTSGNTYYATSNLSTAIYKQENSTFMGTPLSVSDTPVTGVAAGDTLFTGGNVSGSSYAPM